MSSSSTDGEKSKLEVPIRYDGLSVRQAPIENALQKVVTPSL